MSGRGIALLLLRLPVTVFGVGTLLFLLLQLAPGDPARLLLAPGISEEVVAQVRANYGLDRPIAEQYLRWIGALARGDLGWSISAGRPVASVIAELLPSTLLLVAPSLLLAFLVGTAIGTWQGIRAGRADDGILNGVTLFFHAIPSYWLAVMLVLLFAVQADRWGWPIVLPVSGTRGVGYEDLGFLQQFADRVRHLLLPVATLTLVMVGAISRQLRTSVAEAAAADYVRAARARGLSEARVVLRHVLRTALLPLITLAGILLPLAVGGAVFVETVFAWPGMGRALVTAVGARDAPLVLGIGFVTTVVVVIGNVAADLALRWADPRIRADG